MVCHIEEEEDIDRSKLINKWKHDKTVENKARNAWDSQDGRGNTEADSDSGIPSQKRKNGNMEANNHTESWIRAKDYKADT